MAACGEREWWVSLLDHPTYVHGMFETYFRAAGGRFISPVLFTDGHVKHENFTRALTADPFHPYEPTDEWMWYRPE